MKSSARLLRLTQYLVSALLVMTVVLPLWQHFGMERVLEISARSKHKVDVRDDRDDKGTSKGTLIRTSDQLLLTCNLIKDYEWPYCGFAFELGRDSRGIDLSGFDYFTVDIGMGKPGTRGLRAYLRNFEPALSKVGDWQSQKLNEIEFTVPDNGLAVIPIKLLRTAAWWNAARKTPLMHTDVRIDNVTALDLYTGSLNDMGPTVMNLRAIRFHGKWISQNTLLMLLVGAWFLVGVLWVVLSLQRYRLQLRSSKRRLASLTGINKALELEAKELAGQAYTDPLTGALNRQGLRDLLMRQWKTPSLLAQPVSVMFVDLDHFKAINDLHGHDVGDQVLQAFAAMVQREIRSSDRLVRWGGEEFLIVCPHTDLYRAQALAEKLRAAMALLAWPKAIATTASFGVTAMSDSEDIGEAIKRADGALYLAKSNGRNRVELAP